MTPTRPPRWICRPMARSLGITIHWRELGECRCWRSISGRLVRKAAPQHFHGGATGGPPGNRRLCRFWRTLQIALAGGACIRN